MFGQPFVSPPHRRPPCLASPHVAIAAFSWGWGVVATETGGRLLGARVGGEEEGEQLRGSEGGDEKRGSRGEGRFGWERGVEVV